MRHRKKFEVDYQEIISLDNLLLAWKYFQRDKKNKKDVQEFEFHLMDNLLLLYNDLKTKTYTHGPYYAFKINDPKPRDIHKATVRDRIVHHLIYQSLSPFYFPLFIADSYSCQDNKGTHKALKRFQAFGNKVSKNHTKQVWILKCDIRKFFASIDQGILLRILEKHISDRDTLWLLRRVIESFHSTREGVGLPLGNLTSQLLVNIYMNEFDQFMKHTLKAKYYIRYADDFVVFSQDKEALKSILILMDAYLKLNLRLELHPDKVFIKTLASGVDFLGWVHFPKHRVLRTVTKKRMLRRLTETDGKKEVLASCVGLLSHGNGYRLKSKMIQQWDIKNLDRETL